MGQTVSIVAKTVSSVASSVTRIADCVDNEFSKNSPIFAYGMYFDSVYGLFQYDMYLEELKDFIDCCRKKLIDEDELKKYDEKILKNDNKKKIRTIILLNILHKNVTFLRKIIIYSSMMKKNINNNSDKPFVPLVKYSDLLVRLYVIRLVIEMIYSYHEEYLCNLIVPRYPHEGISDTIEEIQRMYKKIELEEYTKDEVDNQINQLKECYKFIDNIFISMKDKGIWQFDIEGKINDFTRNEETKDICRTFFVDFEKIYINLEKQFS